MTSCKSKIPVLFIGHGSPINAIENTVYTQAWKKIGEDLLEQPRAILMVSAHWITQGETRISTLSNPEMIYDMYGFPEELYTVRYGAPGSPEISEEIRNTLSEMDIIADNERWFDHGIWSVLVHLFPEQKIPVIALSIDYSKPISWHYELGKKLRVLREKGVLIVGSGNIVHNLGMLRPWVPYPWAEEFDTRVREDLLSYNHTDIIHFESWWEMAKLAHPSYDHLLPLIVTLGATDGEDIINIFSSGFDLGSISMTSVRWDAP